RAVADGRGEGGRGGAGVAGGPPRAPRGDRPRARPLLGAPVGQPLLRVAARHRRPRPRLRRRGGCGPAPRPGARRVRVAAGRGRRRAPRLARAAAARPPRRRPPPPGRRPARAGDPSCCLSPCPTCAGRRADRMTVAITVTLPDDLHELLIAELADLGFDAFEREDGAVVAYGPAAVWTGVAREAVEDWLRARGLPEHVEERTMLAVNWNARWEATIRPIPVGPFVIAPTWAEVPEEHAGKTLLRIDPKMSFGTGYHESTRLALRFLPGLVGRTPGGERVLDAGTGTGILAIAALRLGAREAVGFDIDPWSAENAAENAALNGVADRFEVREGGI